ncbi:MAG: serine/threonine protein kinase, partial [Deltaproteobacteria bacterium]|nr:serine/threonine protein kinase [Deltaproteobacteria bacterium]
MLICPNCKERYDTGEAFCPEDGARLISQSQFIERPITTDPMIGTVLAGRYEVIRPIGSGGMGVVYEAHHSSLGRRFAVKVLRAQVSQDADVVQRFQREAQSASTIGHENIIEVTDFGQTAGGASFMVMEFLDGLDLADLLAQERRLDVTRALPILLQCCRALDAAHDKGIVHRDIKPENVFLVDRAVEPDFVKIVDFGIAKISDLETPGAPGRKLTKTGMIFGTPEYMSTEQAYGRPTDRRSDIYGLGVIAFEMLTGRTPFEGETFMAVISQHMLDTAPPMSGLVSGLSFHPDLEAIVARTMAKDPDDRFQSMSELHEAFVGFMQREGLPGVPPSHPDVSASSKLPQAPESAAPVPASPTPHRADLTPGILRLSDEPERPPAARSGASWGILLGVLFFVAGGGAALLLFRPDLLGMGRHPDDDGPQHLDIGVEAQVEPAMPVWADGGRDAALGGGDGGAADEASAVSPVTISVSVDTDPP